MSRSSELFKQAQTYIPGGVNSPVRAFRSVGGEPVFIKEAHGAYMIDEDGKNYIDYIGSWGPMILGHNHPEVVAKVKQAIDKGLSFGTATRTEILLAEKVFEMMPAVEMLRLVSSGTEACMSCIRLARGATGRRKILKFNGCYHGHADFLLVKAGSGVATLGIPGSPGVPEGATQDTLTAEYNDLGAVEAVVREHGAEMAAIILEPIAGNAGFIRPEPGFLEGLRRICDEHGILLIFDEVMTGFRVAKGGAQEVFGIKPDLVTLGKVIGGGMPIGAYGGRREIMAEVAPSGPVYQAGTLSGNPVSVACGLATLDLLQKADYTALSQKAETLVQGLKTCMEGHNQPLDVDWQGGMFGFRFMAHKAKNFVEAAAGDNEVFKRFFQGMLGQGVYLAPSAYEAGFISFAHTEEDIANTLAAADKVMRG